MSGLIVFNHLSLDGCFVDAGGDMSWAHAADPEFLAFVADNASNQEAMFLFGRVTYQMMAGWWPTAQAKQAMPLVAERMNGAPKVVFSRTLGEAAWSNTRLLRGGLSEEVRALKQGSGRDLVIMGSGTLVSQLSRDGLVDEYQLVVSPIALGGGRSLFEGMGRRLALKLTKTRSFANGKVLLCYRPE